MQLLERVHLVQFFLFEAQSLALDPTSAIIAPNGAGKSALLDALQIVLLGGDRRHIRFNAQAGGSHRARTIRDYCLGVFRSGEDGRKRRTATSYISLVFRDQETGEPLTAGIALGASVDEPEHRVHGLYLLPGVALELDEHLERLKGKELPLAWASFREHATRRVRTHDDDVVAVVHDAVPCGSGCGRPATGGGSAAPRSAASRFTSAARVPRSSSDQSASTVARCSSR